MSIYLVLVNLSCLLCCSLSLRSFSNAPPIGISDMAHGLKDAHRLWKNHLEGGNFHKEKVIGQFQSRLMAFIHNNP